MKRIAIVSVLVIVVLAATAYVSTRAGYNAALRDSHGYEASGEAAYLVLVLERLRAHDDTGALSMLESELDSYLVYRWVYEHSSTRMMSVFRPNEGSSTLRFLGTASRYRLQYPSTHFEESARSKVAEMVKKYEAFAHAQPASPNNALEQNARPVASVR